MSNRNPRQEGGTGPSDPIEPPEQDSPPIEEQDSRDAIDDPADPGQAEIRQAGAGAEADENAPKRGLLFDENTSGR